MSLRHCCVSAACGETNESFVEFGLLYMWLEDVEILHLYMHSYIYSQYSSKPGVYGLSFRIDLCLFKSAHCLLHQSCLCICAISSRNSTEESPDHGSGLLCLVSLPSSIPGLLIYRPGGCAIVL